jgi:hypothetical protein
MARFGLKIRLPTWAQPFLPVVTGLGEAEVRAVPPLINSDFGRPIIVKTTAG